MDLRKVAPRGVVEYRRTRAVRRTEADRETRGSFAGGEGWDGAASWRLAPEAVIRRPGEVAQGERTRIERSGVGDSQLPAGTRPMPFLLGCASLFPQHRTGG